MHTDGGHGGDDEYEPDEVGPVGGVGGGGYEGWLSPTQLWPVPPSGPEGGIVPSEQFVSLETTCWRCRSRPVMREVGVQTEGGATGEENVCVRCMPLRCMCLEDIALDTQPPAEEEELKESPRGAARRGEQVNPLDDPLPYHVLPGRQTLVRWTGPAGEERNSRQMWTGSGWQDPVPGRRDHRRRHVDAEGIGSPSAVCKAAPSRPEDGPLRR